MAKSSGSYTPPYQALDPAKAAERLGPPVDTDRFARAAAFCEQGRSDLSKRGYAPDGKKRLRKFSIWEICRYLIPVAPALCAACSRRTPICRKAKGPQAPNGSHWKRSWPCAHISRLRG